MQELVLNASLDNFMKGLIRRNPGESEFHQAVHEVAATIIPFVANHERLRDAQVLERLTEPDRVVIIRVVREDDKGGSDFNPKGKSDREIMRFCQSFMTELY